jgi:hypothetical protein
LTKLFNIIRSKREFKKEGKTALIQPIHRRKGSQSLGTTEEFHYYQFWGKIYSEITAYRLREWLIHHKKRTLLQMGFAIGRRTADNISKIKASIDK